MDPSDEHTRKNDNFDSLSPETPMPPTVLPLPFTLEAGPGRSAKDRFLALFEREHMTTMRVLTAYPSDRLNFRPHERCGSARELAWVLVRGKAMMIKALTIGFDWSSTLPAPLIPPSSLDAIVAAFDREHRRVVELLREMPDERLTETVKFFVGPRRLGDVEKLDLLWMVLHDQIHHRGQLTIYLRMAGGKVPSIYGPSADEPWQ
jgi:uncharacterized damage-inducible protein DinB